MLKLVLSAVALLSRVSQLNAVCTCDADITSGCMGQTQPAVSYIDQFSGMTAWLVSASPDDEFGSTETYHLSFNESCGNLVMIYITQLFSDGRETTHTHAMIKEDDSDYYHEPGYDLYLNFFVCDADLVAAYKCKKNADGKTLFLILGPYGKTADQMDLVSCKAKILDIYPQAEFKDMSYPGTKVNTAKTNGGILSTLLKGVVNIVDDLL